MSSKRSRDLSIALTLPYIVSAKDRANFLGEHAAIETINAYGPEVAGRVGRSIAKGMCNPALAEGILVGIDAASDALGITNTATAKAAVKTIFDLFRKSQDGGVFVDGGDEDDDSVFVNFDRETVSCEVAFVRSGRDGVAALPEGGLALTQTFDLRPPGAATPITKEIVHRIIPRPDPEPEPILAHRFAGRPTDRLLIVVPTKEGHSLHIDTDVPVRFTPGLCPMVAPVDLVALPDEVLNAEFVRDEKMGLDISRDSKSGKVRAVVTATYRPANAPDKQGVVPPAAASTDGGVDIVPPEDVRFSGPPASGADANAASTDAPSTPVPAAVDAPPLYNIVLTAIGLANRDKLSWAIHECVVSRGGGVGLPAEEALAYADVLVKNFREGAPVIVAKSASRESADIMCRAIIHTGACAAVIPAVVLAGESAADNAAWHSLMLIDRGVPPHGELAHAIAQVTFTASGSDGYRGAYAQAAKIVDNFTAPVEIARYESQATAERVRASLIECVGERGARFAMVLSEPPPPRIDAPEVPTDPTPLAREESPAPAECAVPKRRASKPRRSR